jgi:glutamate---cysteine ligase / carboxylate-amine ligase
VTAAPGLTTRRATARAGIPTVGVEEEFLLLWPGGDVACVAPEVLAGVVAGVGAHAEFARCQVEVATGVCSDMAGVGRELSVARRALAQAAADTGARLIASGTPPCDAPGAGSLTDDPRYRRLLASVPGVTGEEITCAAQVHVAVASRDVGVAVLGRLRPWLPVLVALSGNSPLWRGRVTGWSSYRFVVQRRWPTFVPPPRCADAGAYDERVADCIAARAALDERGIYFWARLSPRYPTVEIRVADACLTVADSMLTAGLCRALVMGAVADELAGRPVPAVTDRELVAAGCAAARRGLSAVVVDPVAGGWAPAGVVLTRLLRARAPELEASGDGPLVRSLLAARMRRGPGSHCQQALWQSGPRSRFVQGLANLGVGVGVGVGG